MGGLSWLHWVIVLAIIGVVIALVKVSNRDRAEATVLFSGYSDDAAVATAGQRLGAVVLDSLITGVVVAACYSIGVAIGFGSRSLAALTIAIWIVPLIGYVVIGFVYWSMMATRGSSPGKAMVGIQVVRESTGEMPGWGAAFGRYFVQNISQVCTLGIGAFSLFWDPTQRNRAWWDRAAGTIVIQRRGAAIAPIAVPASYGRTQSPSGSVAEGPYGDGVASPAELSGTAGSSTARTAPATLGEPYLATAVSMQWGAPATGAVPTERETPGSLDETEDLDRTVLRPANRAGTTGAAGWAAAPESAGISPGSAGTTSAAVADADAAAAADPTTTGQTLMDLAQSRPDLRAVIAANPSTYDGLLDWLGALGDPTVNAALARRQERWLP